MIPLVTASETGRAQAESGRQSVFLSCGLLTDHPMI
jgi:hypothetical protein